MTKESVIFTDANGSHWQVFLPDSRGKFSLSQLPQIFSALKDNRMHCITGDRINFALEASPETEPYLGNLSFRLLDDEQIGK